MYLVHEHWEQHVGLTPVNIICLKNDYGIPLNLVPRQTYIAEQA
jgi:hypothetical protein